MNIALPKNQPVYHAWFRFLVRSRVVVRLLAHLVAMSIRKSPKKENAVVCLVLKANRFRGDIECLEREAFRQGINLVFLHVHHNWLGRFYRWYYWYNDIIVDHDNNKEQQNEYREFLRKILPSVARLCDIQVVLGPQINDSVCLDWGAVFSELDWPYVVFHREGYMGSSLEQEHLASFGRSGRRFEGNLLAVQTDLMREVLVCSGFVSSDKAVVSGVMRMDDWLRAQDSKVAIEGVHPEEGSGMDWVTLFSFGAGTGITMSEYWPDGWQEGEYLWETVISTHLAVAKFAIRNRDVPVMIKPKWTHKWSEHILFIFEQAGISINDVPNLKICGDIEAHTQIQRSRVVAGYGSTTLFEAAISGKPVIVPSFGEIAPNRPWSRSRTYPDVTRCFDMAENEEHFIELLEARYKKPQVSEHCMQNRRLAFEKYVSFSDASATARSLKFIHEISTS